MSTGVAFQTMSIEFGGHGRRQLIVEVGLKKVLCLLTTDHGAVSSNSKVGLRQPADCFYATASLQMRSFCQSPANVGSSIALNLARALCKWLLTVATGTSITVAMCWQLWLSR